MGKLIYERYNDIWAKSLAEPSYETVSRSICEVSKYKNRNRKFENAYLKTTQRNNWKEGNAKTAKEGKIRLIVCDKKLNDLDVVVDNLSLSIIRLLWIQRILVNWWRNRSRIFQEYIYVTIAEANLIQVIKEKFWD